VALVWAGLWAFTAVAALYSIYLARVTPQWYKNDPATALQTEADANQSDQTVADLFSYANDVAAAQIRRFRTQQAKPGDLIGAKTITLTQQQVDAFVDKWEGIFEEPLVESLGPHIVGGRLILLDHRFLIAGTLKDMGVLSDTVASIEFQPSLDKEGNLWPGMTRVYSGELPLPSLLVSAAQRKFRPAVEEDLNRLQSRAVIFHDGLANGRMAEATLGKLLQAALDGQAVDSVIFLPCNLGGLQRAVPIRVTDLSIANQELTVSLRPLSDDELKGR
jgi:hypothetical protein